MLNYEKKMNNVKIEMIYWKNLNSLSFILFWKISGIFLIISGKFSEHTIEGLIHT